MTSRRLWRVGMPVVLLLVVAGVAAPFLSLNGFGPHIQAALEGALKRHVTIGRVRLNLFTGPGFTVDDVLIEEDPRVGIEPFAYVTTLDARIRLRALFTGHLAFSTLRLSAPSVNFVKTAAGAWNIQEFLNPGANRRGEANAFTPDIEVRGGRLNFKHADTKSVFYINDADLDIFPNGHGGLVIRFSGEPARTDRGAQGFGHVTGRGTLQPTAGGPAQLEMAVQLARSSVSELVTLFQGHDLGVHGYAASSAMLIGPLSNIAITGELRLEDIHRWDVMADNRQAWTLQYRGNLNVPGRVLDLETVPGKIALPVMARVRATEWLTQPKWAATLVLQDAPAGPLLETAKHLGAPLLPGATIEGKVSGVIGYGAPGGLQGQLSLAGTTLALPEAALARIDGATLTIGDGDFAFGPASIRAPGGGTAEIEAKYTARTGELAVKIGAKQFDIALLRAGASRFLGPTRLPLLELCDRGTWRGSIGFASIEGGAGEWSGEYELQNAQMNVPDLAAPVRIAAAAVDVRKGRVRVNKLKGRVGDVRFEGDYRFDPDSQDAPRVRLSIPVLDVGECERLLLPVLDRSQGLLTRLRLRDVVAPDWLKQRSLSGPVEVALLVAGERKLGSLQGNLRWEGASLRLTHLRWGLEDATGVGSLAVNVGGPAPEYDLRGQVSELAYREGVLDLDGKLEASGTGEQAVKNARAEGTFKARDVALTPASSAPEIEGLFRMSWPSSEPRLVLDQVHLTEALETFTGKGASQPDGGIVLELTSGRKQMRYVAQH